MAFFPQIPVNGSPFLSIALQLSFNVSSWVVSIIQSLLEEHLCFGHCLFPDLGKTWLPDERIPHSLSSKYHQEEVTREEREGQKGAISSHLFPSSISHKGKSAQHRISKAEGEARHSQDSGESVCGLPGTGMEEEQEN